MLLSLPTQSSLLSKIEPLPEPNPEDPSAADAVAQLMTHHRGICQIPVIIANSAPGTIMVDLHTPLMWNRPSHQSHICVCNKYNKPRVGTLMHVTYSVSTSYTYMHGESARVRVSIDYPPSKRVDNVQSTLPLPLPCCFLPNAHLTTVRWNSGYLLYNVA